MRINMKKSPYRNAIRSQKLIREAFLELVQVKELDKITVAEITQRADLSRNTFYTHYQDIYAVLEELQNEAMMQLKIALEDARSKHQLDKPLEFLEKLANILAASENQYKILLKVKGADIFIAKLKQTVMEHVIEGLDAEGITKPKEYLIFLEILSSGFISLFQMYLCSETDLTPKEIVAETNRLYVMGIELYK